MNQRLDAGKAVKREPTESKTPHNVVRRGVIRFEDRDSVAAAARASKLRNSQRGKPANVQRVQKLGSPAQAMPSATPVSAPNQAERLTGRGQQQATNQQGPVVFGQ